MFYQNQKNINTIGWLLIVINLLITISIGMKFGIIFILPVLIGIIITVLVYKKNTKIGNILCTNCKYFKISTIDTLSECLAPENTKIDDTSLGTMKVKTKIQIQTNENLNENNDCKFYKYDCSLYAIDEEHASEICWETGAIFTVITIFLTFIALTIRLVFVMPK
jgi:hypothetical protein